MWTRAGVTVSMVIGNSASEAPIHQQPFSRNCAHCRQVMLGLTFVHARVFVLNHRQLIDLAKLLKDRLQVLFFQIPRNLPHKQLDGIGLLHQDGVESRAGSEWGLNRGGGSWRNVTNT